MKVALIEDEAPALQHLEALLVRVRPDAEVIARLRTVRQTRAWLATDPPCDLILADIQLGDGLSLDAFAEVARDVPIVFATAFDHHLVPALATNGIAYLLKPLQEADLRQALTKHDRLQRHYLAGLSGLVRTLREPVPSRIVGRRGLDWVGVPIDEVRWVRVRHGSVHAWTADGAELMLEDSLARTQARLEPMGFFRANRWYLVSLAAVARVRPEGRGRLQLQLEPAADEPVVVPQESAAAFRAWFGM